MNTERAAFLTVALLGVGVALHSAPATAAASGKKLVLNGHVASWNVRMVNGQAFAPLNDVASALGMVVVRRGDGSYEIKKAGGTYQVGNLSGKVGDVLFDGKWRLQLLAMSTPDTYKMRTNSQPYNEGGVAGYDPTTRVVKPNDGYKLVVMKVRVTNGQHESQTLWTAISDPAIHTALTDTDGSSHPPLDYDYAGGNAQTPPMLPGASLTFNIVFSVAQDTVLKDFIMTLKNNDSAHGNDARVSLR